MTRRLAGLALGGVLGVFFWNGCGMVSPNGTDSLPSSFLGVNVTKFSGVGAVPVTSGSLTVESTAVGLPGDLLSTAPADAVMVLSMPDLRIAVNDAGASVPPSGVYHATVTFRLAPIGEDACTSDNVIGPFILSMVDGTVTVNVGSLPLDAATQEAVRSGQIALCAEAWADFNGTISLGKLSIEFGSLPEDEDRVELCHIPPGNPQNRHNITVGSSAVATHLAHGDYLGQCRDAVSDLTLAQSCWDAPADVRRWQIQNPNAFGVSVTWTQSETSQTATVTAPPGESYFFTDAVAGTNTVALAWQDEAGVSQTDTKTSDGMLCDSSTDTDNDGVPDGTDHCPSTPVGATVDAEGCSCLQAGTCNPVDTDGDGIPDATDTCPSTPTGETVDTVGCSCSQLDDDLDGVMNCSDSCPDTVAGEIADASGCACSQRDGDLDDVADCDDSCPNTPVGEVVDAVGCGCSQLDGDLDGVTNCDDLCPNTPEGAPIDGLGCETMLANAGSDITLDEVGPVTLQGAASGGTSPYRYAWSAPGWQGSSVQNPVVLPSATTTYTLTVTDWSFPQQVAVDTVTVTIRQRTSFNYTITNLGSLSVNSSYPASINENGDVVGYYYSATYAKRAFLWRQGVMTDLGTLGGKEAYARDINNAGQVVGESRTASGQWHAFLWDETNGMRDLGTLGGTTSYAYAINAGGEVVGYSSTGSANQGFLYRNGIMTSLAQAGYAQSAAFGINDVGQVVGILLTQDNVSTAAMYYNGTMTDLGSPLLDGSQFWTINNAGLIAAFAWNATEYRSFLFFNGTVIDLGSLTGYPQTYVWGMSETGQMVGSVTNAGGTLSHAFLYTGGQLHDLNDVLPAGQGWEYLTAAYAVNSSGQIAGYGRINGQYRGFLMTPVP